MELSLTNNKRRLVLHLHNKWEQPLQFLYVGFITSEQVHSRDY